MGDAKRRGTFEQRQADGDEFFGSGEWAGDKFDQYVLAHGLLHLTPEAAAKHGRAMCIMGE